MSTNDEIAAPMGTEAWDDTALLEAFERAAASHNQANSNKEDKSPKASVSKKKKTTVIFKRSAAQDEHESEDDGEAYIAPPNLKADPPIVQHLPAPAQQHQQNANQGKATATQHGNPTTQPNPANVQYPYEPHQYATYNAQSYPTGYQPQLVPTLPDMEEQEALSQLLLAWYQAGYAAGRYASIRQRH